MVIYMSNLTELQFEHVKMVAKLIGYAYKRGYRLTWGDTYRDPRVFGMMGTTRGYGHPYSNHKLRLAVDFNLFKKVNGEWEYCRETEAHKVLGKYWQKMGGAWGGSWGDGNHYSLEFNGRK